MTATEAVLRLIIGFAASYGLYFIMVQIYFFREESRRQREQMRDLNESFARRAARLPHWDEEAT